MGEKKRRGATNHHKLSDRIVLSHFWRPEAQNQGVGRVGSSRLETLRENLSHASLLASRG